jgi:hypothetical protein
VEDHRVVPHFWIHVPSNPKPPKRMRDETRQVVHKHGGRLIEDELYFKPTDPKLGYGTVDCKANAIAAIAEELNAEYERVLTTDETIERIKRRRARARGGR